MADCAECRGQVQTATQRPTSFRDAEAKGSLAMAERARREAPRTRIPARVEPQLRPDGRVRWMARLDSRDEAAYERAVARIAPFVERRLGEEVIADRVRARGRHPGLRLEPWRPARRRWLRAVTRALGHSQIRFAVITDVADCFGSITPTVAERSLKWLGPGAAAASEILRTIHADGVRGLPIGPRASAVVANAVLLPMDEAMRDLGIRHVRWVDDVVAFVPDRRSAARVLGANARVLEDRGLRLNPDKTAVLGWGDALLRLGGRGLSPAGDAACDDSAR